MTTTLSPSTWIQALPTKLKRLLGAQQSSSSGSNQASTPENPTEGTTNHDDEWGDWAILTHEGEEQVEKDVPPLAEEDEIHDLRITFEELIIRQRAMVGQREVAGDQGQRTSEEEKEDDQFHLEEIPAGIRMPCHTPPDSDDTRDVGPCLLDLSTSGWRWQYKPGKSRALDEGGYPYSYGRNGFGKFVAFEKDNAEG
ncbi:hypothetical protein CDV36_013008 [Fusarium kuroshium]|uniref:Uncharacterized protein n=1 Tax=Fusarium kuroshium TaxID=2010991 RepID=A0A3M2RQ20_9HYPO|nr:hypothetical protein CDV36_013008 [Fusarium kuroshium]